ncbi:MAG: MBL fold metallo-hydrolase [Solirubrobacteraceae bacterium]
MIVERSMSDPWLSNTYVVADELGGHAVMIDAGGPVAPLLDYLRRGQLELTHVLLTHHHHDHVADLEAVREAHPGVPVLIHPLERDLVSGTTGVMEPGQPIESGALHIEPIHTPGHTGGMLSLLVDGSDVFTGDTLFRGSVGGVRAPGHTTYADLKSSIMDKLLKLPAATRIHPGHTEPTTVADELESNRFVRIWQGTDQEGTEPCRALGEEATLILLGDDYDGGHKAWVRWPDGADDIVPGSQVQRAE